MPDDTDDLAGLKSALDKERKSRESVERKLKELTDAQELGNKTLADQVASLQQQLRDKDTAFESEKAALLGDLQQRDIRSAFASAYGAEKGLPEYSDVLYAHLGGNLQVVDGKVATKDGKPLNEAIATARKALPAFFAPVHDAAGGGATGSNTNGAGNGGARVVGSDVNATRTIDPTDLISGKVVLE